ncbi:OmpA family protein [Cricetibacter osteomyelitidis]|uniref:OmpA family protein n=1 Tax=Cricetibacter osteomyelitidis TaxID=1521931 RepID=A0A4R2T4Q0_9PAST|nr:OmpA family protein [Cricetibacter osteomyelitidis]TCP92038.1 OmpA family protein [Cricetibacter osteomyelitidis]
MKKALLVVSVALALSACSSPRGENQALEKWQNYGKPTISTSELAENQTLAVFYRKDDIASSEAVDVFINGDYQASLVPNSVTSIAVCAAKQLFTGSFNKQNTFGNRVKGATHILPVNEIAYIRVSLARDGNFMFTRVEEQQAKQEMINFPQAAQTISRVSESKCGTPVLSNFELSANALFPLNGSSYNSILPYGKDKINDLAQHLKTLPQEKISDVQIQVSGYTDSFGSEQYNLKLSQKRADTVKEALVRAGVTLPMTAVGYGEKDLAISNCSTLHKTKKAIIECNAPNRRVDVTVYGKK